LVVTDIFGQNFEYRERERESVREREGEGRGVKEGGIG
jgi:hypothetical protein